MGVEKRGLSAWTESAACGLHGTGLEQVSVEEEAGLGATSGKAISEWVIPLAEILVAEEAARWGLEVASWRGKELKI